MVACLQRIYLYFDVLSNVLTGIKNSPGGVRVSLPPWPNAREEETQGEVHTTPKEVAEATQRSVTALIRLLPVYTKIKTPPRAPGWYGWRCSAPPEGEGLEMLGDVEELDGFAKTKSLQVIRLLVTDKLVQLATVEALDRICTATRRLR